MRGGLYDHPSDMLVGGFRWTGRQLRRCRRSGDLRRWRGRHRERCLAQLGKGVIVNQALGEDVVVGRAVRPSRHPRSADGGSYASAVVSRSAACLALLARRSGFKLGMLAQTVP